MTEPYAESLHLPQIDHLTVAQLRQRATRNREDALRLSVRQDAGAVTMLLADAERCDARADELEARCAPARLAGLDEMTVEGALEQLLEASRGSVASVQALVVRGAEGGSQYAFAAAGLDGARRGDQNHRSPTVADAYMATLRSLWPAEALS